MHRTRKRLGRQALIYGALVAPAPFAIDMFLPALPQITAELDASVPATQATLTAYFFAFGAAHLIYGPWSDAKGRLPALRVGILLFLLGSVACALAPTIEALIAARMVQAAGAAALTVLPRAMIRDHYLGSDATKLTALLMLVLSVSPLFAPLAGSVILTWGDWRYVFASLAVGAGVSYILAQWHLPETLPPIERYALSRRALVVGLRRLLTDQTFMGLTALASFGLANFFVFVALAPYVYEAQFGLDHTQVSIALAVNGLGFFITAQMAAPLASKMGTDRAMLMGAVGFGLCIATLAVSMQVTDVGLAQMIAFLALANAALGVTIPTALARALEPHGPIAGLAASVSGAIQMAVTGVLILMASVMLDTTLNGMIAALTICGTLVVVVALAVLRPRVGQRGWVSGFEI